MRKVIIILFSLFFAIRLSAQSDSLEEQKTFMQINPASVHNVLLQKKDSFPNITRLSICGDSYGRNFIIENHQFPNVEEIEMSGISSIMSFDGLEGFEKLRKISICFDGFSTLLAIPTYGFYNITNIYNVLGLKTIYIEPGMYLQKNLGFGFFINDTNFCHLSELQILEFPSIYNPIWLFAKMPNLKDVSFIRMNDRVEYVDDIQTYLLMNAKADLCILSYKRKVLRKMYKHLKINNPQSFTGKITVKYKDGKVACHGCLKNGFPTGTWVYYDNNSESYYEEKYEEGCLISIKNSDTTSSFPYIVMEKNENVEKYCFEHNTNGDRTSEVVYKIILSDGNILIACENGTIHCIDVNQHVKYFIRKNEAMDSYTIGVGFENYRKYDSMYHSFYTIDAGKLKIEYESTNRDLSMLEKEKINQICRKETYDSLQNILNTEKMNFELLKTNNYGK